MKKLIVALSAGALMMGTSAMAESENSALIINIDGVVGNAVCNFTVPLLGLFNVGGEYRSVLTKSGNTLATCEAEVPEGVVKKAVVVKDIKCIMASRTDGLVAATSSKLVVTPSGNVKVQCHFNPIQVD